jgi:RTX calcium-binding nonapeptide repeat (4 copies)
MEHDGYRIRALLALPVLGLATATIGFGVAAPPVAAAPPANDAFAGAQTLSGALPMEVAGTNVEATKESGEPVHAGVTGGASVWYRWTPSVDAFVAISTCRSDFDTLLGVYRGSAVDALTEVTSNDDGCSFTFGSVVSLGVTAGTTYYIAVDGLEGAQGSIVMTVAGIPAPNDDFADAQELGGPLPIEVPGTNYGTGFEPGEPIHGFADATVWYRWTAGFTGSATVEVCDNDFDAALAVYTGSRVDELTQVARNLGAPCGYSPPGSRVTFQAAEGETYFIAVDGLFFGDQGFFRLRLPTRPANDDFAHAEELSGSLPLAVTGTNVDATRELGEPEHAGGGGSASVWYRWTPSASGPAVVGTCGSGFDTLLGVYTGPSLEDLSEVGADDDGCGPDGRGSEVTFVASAGTAYLIAVDGFPDAEGLATGSIALSVGAGASPLAPAPKLSGTAPLSPANDNAPRVTGEAQVGGTVRLYRDDPTCTGAPDATGSAVELGSIGIELRVPDDATTTIRATATAPGGTSVCSAPITYVEDSTPPPTPTLTRTNPSSGANMNRPRVVGRAQAGATVRLYANKARCSGAPDAVGSAARFGGAGIAIRVVDNATTKIRATAVDAGGESACSPAIAYSERTARCAGRRATIVGTARGELIRGTAGRDVIAGLGGSDELRGLAGNDLLCGGRGDDRLIGGRGRDVLRGGPGDDDGVQGTAGRR